jgi:DNA-binding transcriptional ArsR family regulator
MSRVTLNDWLRAVETRSGPMPPELRHLCYLLARFMSGDGSGGCFPGTRTLAIRMGVSHAAVSRRLRRLREAGWLDVEPRRRQFGKPGWLYFPAIPMERLSVPINAQIGTPNRSNSVIGTLASNGLERSQPELERSLSKLERLSVPDSLTDSLTEKSAASPAFADATSAAPERMTDAGLCAQVRLLRQMHWTDERILKKFAKHGMTSEHLAGIVTKLAREKAMPK